MIKVKKITSPDAWELRQARIDEAIVTGRPFVERPSYFEHVDTGQKYYDLFGCIGWPTEDTDKDKGRPGYVAVVAVVKSERPIQNAWFRLMGEGESEHISELFAHILRLREEYGFGLQPALLQTFLGDPDKHTTRLALLNEELIKKYGDNYNIKYLKYLIKHKYYVTVECFKRGLYWRGLTHDLSKFLPDEFIPYMNFFYGKSKEFAQSQFDFAWLKHQKRNPHHWQWWILKEDSGEYKIFEMSREYREEMLCDWHGAGKAIMGKNSNTKEWYLKNKDKTIIALS